MRPGIGAGVGLCDQAQHALAILGVDHSGEKAPRRLARVGAELREHASDACGLQSGEFQRQRLARRADIQQALAAIVGALLLHDIAFVNQLLEDATERLFGDLQDVEQAGDFHAGVAVDEMQDAMMGAAEAELGQHFIGIADEVAIGEEQELDEVKIGLAGRGLDRSLAGSRGARLARRRDADVGHLGQVC